MSEIQCVEYKEWDGKEEKKGLRRKKHMAMHMHADLHQSTCGWVTAWRCYGEQSEAGLKTLPLHSVLPHPVKTDLSDANVDLSTHVNIHINKKYLALQLHLKYSVLYVCIHNI